MILEPNLTLLSHDENEIRRQAEKNNLLLL